MEETEEERVSFFAAGISILTIYGTDCENVDCSVGC